MKNIFEFIENHSILLQSFFTFALIGITAWYTYLTRKLVKTTIESQRPYVFVDFQGIGPNFLEIIIENSGYKVANNVSFQVIKDLEDRKGTPLSSYLPFMQGFTHLPPKRTYKYRFLIDAKLFTENLNSIFEVKVTYSDVKKKYEDHFIIDLSPFKSILFSSFKNPIDGVTAELSRIRSSHQFDRQFSHDNLFKKDCPYCCEKIIHGAKKCPHCHEYLQKKD